MKTLSLSQLLVSGFILSLLASLSMFGLSLFFSFNTAFNLCLSLVGLLYVLQLLKTSNVKIGRISLVGVYIFSVLTMLLIGISSELLLVSVLIFVFGLRAFYFHQNIFTIFFDGLLVTAGVFAASAVLILTNSWFLAYWSFFVTQALMIFIPDLLNLKTKSNLKLIGAYQLSNNYRFNEAIKSAHQAIQQISVYK